MDKPDPAERARRIQERIAETQADGVKPWDDTAPPADRARAYLDLDPSHRVRVIAPTFGAAKTWAKEAGVDRVTWVQRNANLYGLNGEAFVVVLPGSDMHPEWRNFAKTLNHLQRLDATVIVIDAVDELEFVGGIVIEPGNRIRPVPPRQRQGDSLVIYDDGKPIARLDRVAAEQLRRIVAAYVDGEPIPDPAREAAERIRREIEETGDLYGRGAEEEDE